MSEKNTSLQPGPVFYEVFLGALRIMGTNVKDWSAARGVDPSNTRMAATGFWNGPKARDLRNQMVDHVGREMFTTLYKRRLEIENRGAA